MNEIDYISRWDAINKHFIVRFDGESWTKQQDYLEKSIGKEFSVSKVNIKKIFESFNDIYKEDFTIHFDWDEYQFPTLVAITSNYVKQLR